MQPTFSAGGLASGLDTNTIIDKLVQLESTPLDLLRRRQTALRSQVSALGDLASGLSSLESAARSLGDGGILSLQATAHNTSFAAAPGTRAAPGRYSIRVDALAAAAKARSQAFASPVAPVTGGTLTLTVLGQVYSVSIPDGAALSDVALAIRQSGAPVSATVLSDGAQSFLSLTNRDTGYPIGGAPGAALSISEATTGVLGQPLSAAVVQTAQNASLTVDGLALTRTANTVADAIPGIALTLQAAGGVAEDLVVATDPGATEARLQQFVDAYNAVMRGVQKQLGVTDKTQRASTLAGDSAVRSLQTRMQGLVSSVVPGLAGVRSLADLGVRTARDGSLSVDSDTLSAALARDSAAANALFSTASAGVADSVSRLVQRYVNPVDGILTARQSGLGGSIKQMDQDADRLQARIDGYRAGLMAQFAAMEQVVSSLKAISSFLLQQQTTSSK